MLRTAVRLLGLFFLSCLLAGCPYVSKLATEIAENYQENVCPAGRVRVDVDYDCDGISDNMEFQLAVRHAPLVRLVQNERSLPGNVDWLLRRAAIAYVHRYPCGSERGVHIVAKGNLSSFEDAALAYRRLFGLFGWGPGESAVLTPSNMHLHAHPELASYADSQQFICQHGNEEIGTDADVAGVQPNYRVIVHPDERYVFAGAPEDQWTVYIHVRESVLRSDWIDIQYWFYYHDQKPFLDEIPGIDGFGEHEGDWENATIVVDENGDPRYLWTSQHKTGRVRSFSYEDCNTGSGVDRIVCTVDSMGNQRIVLYSALDTHATYTYLARCQNPAGLSSAVLCGGHGADSTCAAGFINCEEWETWVSVQNLGERNYPMAGREYIRYNGRWGVDYGETDILGGLIDTEWFGDGGIPFTGESPFGPAMGKRWTKTFRCGDSECNNQVASAYFSALIDLF